MKKKNCLIIGGAGYIGSVLLDLINNQFNITVFDNFLFSNIREYKRKYKHIKFIKGDINNDIKNIHFKDIFGGIASIHCAWKLND